MSLLAQSDYNPPSPAEPTVIDFCRIAVSADPVEGATVSGGGKYKVTNGGRVYISTSAKNTEDYTYTFQYWTLNGVKYTTSRSFYYTVQKGDMNFVAHYAKSEVEYDPANPAEPSGSTIKRKYYLYLNSNMDGACSFNIDSGTKHEEGSKFYLRVYPNAYFKFEGWKVNDKIISTSTSFYYTMPSATTTIEAVFSEIPYDPESPIDPPSSGQDDVDDTDSSRKLITLTIGNDDNSAMDKTRAVLNEEKSTDYEADCDAAKFSSDDAKAQIYSIGGEVKYQINERPTGNGKIALGIVIKESGTYFISPLRLDCEDAVLYDKVLNVSHPLATGAYSFSSAAGTFDSRFELRVPASLLLGDVNGDESVTISDVVATLSIIKGKVIDNLNYKAADINDDGMYTISDVVGILGIIKNKK